MELVMRTWRVWKYPRSCSQIYWKSGVIIMVMSEEPLIFVMWLCYSLCQHSIPNPCCEKVFVLLRAASVSSKNDLRVCQIIEWFVDTKEGNRGMQGPRSSLGQDSSSFHLHPELTPCHSSPYSNSSQRELVSQDC